MSAAVLSTPTSPLPDLLDEIRRREEARLRSLSKAYPRSVPIASDVDPASCLRRQVLQIVAWQDRPLPEPDLQARFEVGILQEREGIAKLLQLGFDVVEQQVPFELVRRGGGREVVLRGKVDGKIRWGAQRVPFEIKSLHPNIYERVETLADFDRWAWARRYPSQLQAYLIGHGAEWGFFLLTDCLGHWRMVRIELDLDLAERIWRFAEAAHDGVVGWRRDGTLPGYSADPTECARCEFFGRACQPELVERGAALLRDPELVADLERREALIAAGARELDGIDRSVKERLRAALPASPQRDGETLQAYAARLKAAGPAGGIAGRFAVSVAAKFVRAEREPRAARVDRVVSIEPLLPADDPGVPAIVNLYEQLKASVEARKAAK